MYFSNQSIELIYHVSTMMPPSEDNSKKRHIGNDKVLVVWSESSAKWDPHTITGCFNKVQVVVRPLKGGLYNIYI